MEVTSDYGDYQLRVDEIMRVKISKVQGRQYSGYGIKF